MRKQCYVQSTTKEHHENCREFGAVQHCSLIGIDGAMKYVNQNKRGTPQNCFRASQFAVNGPEYDNDRSEAEGYLRSDLDLLSDKENTEPLEISPAIETEKSLL